MTPNPQPFLDMFKKLGEDLKVPAMDLEPILAHHRKNLEALAASGKAAAEGATALAAKQREIMEAAVKDIQEAAQGFRMPGSAQEMMAAQADFARRAMEAAVRNTRDLAELLQKSNSEAVRVIHDRMQESFEEIRQAFQRKA